MNRLRFFVLLIAAVMLPFGVYADPQSKTPSAGISPESETAEPLDYFDEKVTIEYSTAFDVEYHNNYKIVTVSKPWPGAKSGFTYLLVQRGTTAPQGIAADKVIEIPIRSIVTMSTSYLPCMEELGVLETLAGHESFAWVYSEAVRDRIASGEMKEVGSGPTVNIELLLEMEPDLIMTYGIGNEWDTHPKLEEAMLPYVVNAEWNEKTPLGRAEWIKYVSLFYNKEAEAAAYFTSVVEEYTALLQKASATEKPSVFAGTPYQGTWWMSGGGSFAAQLFADSGAAYVWAGDDSTGSLMLDIETVFEKAGGADYWINTGYWNSLADAKAADERFTEFKAYKTGMMYNNNMRMSPGGGNDYFESAPVNPNRVLADLIKIFHPELLPDHELYYYKKLE